MAARCTSICRITFDVHEARRLLHHRDRRDRAQERRAGAAAAQPRARRDRQRRADHAHRSGRGDRRICEPAFETITGYTSAQVVGRDHAGLARAGQQGLLFEQMAQALAAGSGGTAACSRRADGSAFWGQLYVAPVRDDLTYHICVISDLTELIDSRDQLVRQARRDALTGLPNRATLRELIEQAVAEQRAFALLFMDVDRLKDINDSLGHGAGDRLLREVAQRLSGCVGDDGTVTRYGGDEFVAMLGRPDDGDRLAALLRRIARALERPVQIGDAQSRVQLSIGVACYPADGLDAETLLKHADLAMYQAKARGRNTVELFQPSFAEAAERRIALSHRLRAALEHDGFELAYQPQIDVRTSRVSGVEALLRWHDPEMGAVSPATFIPLAEDIGLIGQLGEWRCAARADRRSAGRTRCRRCACR
jgi:diguanylate cyclase (GGDEF)-like protein/PAS domain S-box-containing protein